VRFPVLVSVDGILSMSIHFEQRAAHGVFAAGSP